MEPFAAAGIRKPSQNATSLNVVRTSAFAPQADQLMALFNVAEGPQAVITSQIEY
jgi:hypothetical protein